VSGVLPIAIEEAVKILRILTHTAKEYIALMELHKLVGDERLYEVIEMFRGEIYQRPPLRSSVKRSLRIRRVHKIEIIDKRDRWVLMRIETDPGTYIRKIIHDIGLLLGVRAHMRELRRVKSGIFTEDLNLVTLHMLSEAMYIYKNENKDDLLRKYIMPIEVGVAHLPKIIVDTNAVDPIARGAQLAVPGISVIDKSIARGDLLAILSPKAELVAIARAELSAEEIITREKGIAATTLRVIMRPGLYPRWIKKEKKI